MPIILKKVLTFFIKAKNQSTCSLLFQARLFLLEPVTTESPLHYRDVRGGFLSEASLLSEKYHCDAYATQTGVAITIPTQALREALMNSDFAIKWVQLLSREIMRLRTQSERLSLKDIKSKLLHLIETEGTKGTLKLQADFKSLASEIGVTHEALYRTISTLEKDGTLIKTSNSLQLTRKKNLSGYIS
jgi:CRP-like cAMP-binding protein